MTLSRRSVLLAAGGTVLAGALPAAAERVRIVGGSAFGTWWRVCLPVSTDDARVVARIRTVIASVDAAASPFRTDSEISRFNAARSHDWQALSPAACDVVTASLEAARLTAGAFDPTVGPVVAAYGFGPIRTGSAGRYADIEIAHRRVRKSDPGLTVDPCGIAKGYALDRIADALRDLRVDDFLVELGGEVLARGRHPDDRAWQIGIERPVRGPTAVERIVRLGQRALATSGDSMNSYSVMGRRYSHIIDPRSAAPVDNDIASVSVFMPTATLADAFATALMVMGAEEGATFAERERVPALFLVRDGADLREITTSGFADAIVV